MTLPLRLRLLPPAAARIGLQAIVNDVIYLAHFYNVRHVLDGCMAFLTSEANALSGDPTSPAYALRWLHVGERLQLDAVAKRWVRGCSCARGGGVQRHRGKQGRAVLRPASCCLHSWRAL